MPLDFAIERSGEDESVLVLPYVRNFEDGRTNHGFEDMRGRPELVDAVAETGLSPALKDLLRALAQSGAAYFSVGCDLRAFPPREPGQPHEVSGYIQIISSDLARDAVHRRRQVILGCALEDHLDQVADDEEWAVRYSVAQVDAADLGGPDLVWSPVIEFHGFGETETEAAHSAERLIQALRYFVS